MKNFYDAINCRKEKYRGLFVSDLDGTLLTNERKIAPADLEALSQLRRMGYLTAIATGRSNYSFNKLMNSLGYSGTGSLLPVDYIIFSTGAGIMDFPGTRLLKSFSLSPEDVHRIVDCLETSHLDYMIHRPVPDTRHFLYSYHSGTNPDFDTRLKIYQEFARPFSPQALNNLAGATEVLCIVPSDKGHAVAAELLESLDQYSVIKATSPLDGKSIWIEIFTADVSKSKAVRWLAKRASIPRENICAVGNDFNDEDLLHWAAKGFVVSNSPPSLKSVFQTVASNDRGGVSEAANRWLNL
jgi:Cof subfamily protein (haloacid dehalogenase superfamily)